jgi:branched-subunit amino acid ABC-type transport system permease component
MQVPGLHQSTCYHIEVAMNLEALLASSIDGLMLGFIYGLAAMGLTLIFGVMRVINLAHGPVIMLGMYTVYEFTSRFGMNPYLAMVLAVFIGLLFGIVMYFVAVHKVINAPELTTLLATFSVNLMIIGIATVVWTTTPHAVDVQLPAFHSGAVTILGTRAVAVLVAIIVTGALYYFLYRTHIGKSIRAVANNRNAAELMGINTTAMLALSFGIGTMLAAISGGLISTLFSFTVLSGGTYETKSFVMVVLGGLGNPTGALLGGIFIGLLEGVTTIFMPVAWVPIIEYVIFVLILLIRPNGLFGGAK